MTTEIATGVLVLGSLVTGIWIGWRVHHLMVVEDVKKELVVFNREVATSIQAVHSRIDQIIGLPKTIEEKIITEAEKLSGTISPSSVTPTNN